MMQACQEVHTIFLKCCYDNWSMDFCVFFFASKEIPQLTEFSLILQRNRAKLRLNYFFI